MSDESAEKPPAPETGPISNRGRDRPRPVRYVRGKDTPCLEAEIDDLGRFLENEIEHPTEDT